MLYQTTRHLWLNSLESGQVMVSNVATGRRALLESADLQALERFTAPTSDDGAPLTRRLIEADLVVPVGGAKSAKNPRAEAISFAVDKYLAEQRGMSRRRLCQEIPDATSRLEKTLELVVPHLREVDVASRVLPRRHSSEYFTSTIDHVRTYLGRDAYDDDAYAFAPGFLSATAARPSPRLDYEQQPCLPHTTQERVNYAVPNLGPESRCLILGDDDLIGLYLSDQMAHVLTDLFELDPDLLAFLEPRLQSHVKLHSRDLTEGLPNEYHGLYDAVFTDPMYEANGMTLFLKCCRQGLSGHPNARVYLSTRPDLTQLGDGLFDRFAELGLRCVARHRDFSRYAFTGVVRERVFRDFQRCGAPMQLVDGLLNTPYLYADLFELALA